MNLATFNQKWSASGAAESSNAQSFVNDLYELLGVAKPDPATGIAADNAYVFEKRVTGRNGNTKFIDCYKRGHFILENKQGATVESPTENPALSSTHRTRGRAQKTQMAEDEAGAGAARARRRGRPPAGHGNASRGLQAEADGKAAGHGGGAGGDAGGDGVDLNYKNIVG